MMDSEARADELLATLRPDDLAGLELRSIEKNAPLAEQVAVKLADSKARLRSIPEPVHVSVVFAMYKETERMASPKSHPHGEDFINVKAGQLEWLFEGSDGWDLVMVDDGCPDGSGRLAEAIIADNGLSPVARVLHLADAIRTSHPATVGLTDTNDSRKGGSILYGMYEAAQRGAPEHVVAYTDADLSTNLGQVGLLVDQIKHGAACAAGSRREPTSVVVKGGTRNDRGKLFIYLWKQILPQLGDLIDTQCGFKGFPAGSIGTLTHNTTEKGFAFDIELLLRCAIGGSGPIGRVPIAWVDSEEASTTTDLEPYLDMLRAVATMYRTYLVPSPRAEQFALLVESLTESDWKRLVSSIPTAIAEREPLEFTTWAGVEVETLAALASG